MMNKVILIGRLTKNPEIRYSQNGNGIAVGRYHLAVAKKLRREGETEADFFPVVVFGKAAEFAEKYLRKGSKIALSGRLTQEIYTDKNCQRVSYLQVVGEEQYFAEGKSEGIESRDMTPQKMDAPGDMESEYSFL